MDKIKNILNPGKAQDDAVLYGSGEHQPSKGYSGEGSHFGNVKDNTGSTNTTTSSTAVDHPSTTVVGAGNHFTSSHSGPDVPSTTSTQSHTSPTTTTGVSDTTSVPHTQGTATSATSGSDSAGLNPAYSQSTPRDNASVSGVKSGIPGSYAHDSTTTSQQQGYGPAAVGDSSTHRSVPAGSGSSPDKPSETGRSSHQGGTAAAVLPSSSRTTAGPHSSDVANKADPRVDSDRDGSSRTGTTGAVAGTLPSGSHTTAGPHSSDIANKADPRVDSDRDGSHGISTTGAGAGTRTDHSHTTAGPHSSDVANKTDPQVDSDRDGSSKTGTSGVAVGTLPSGSHTTAGPHSSDLANKADPRVDSDRDGSHGTSTTGAVAGATGHSSTPRSNIPDAQDGKDRPGPIGPLFPSGSTGPHATDTANVLDPAVTSTTSKQGGHIPADSATAPGAYASKEHYREGTTTGATNITGSSTTHGSDQTRGTSSTTAGPHSSALANKADPRVDSDHSKTTGDHTARNAALGGGAVGLGGVAAYEGSKRDDTTGASSTTTSTGTSKSPYSSSAIDPRVDSATSGSQKPTGTISNTSTTSHSGTAPTVSHPDTGPAPNTAGPHKSDLLNKLDPRVDSDLSKQKDDQTTRNTSANAAVVDAGAIGTGTHVHGKHGGATQPTGPSEHGSSSTGTKDTVASAAHTGNDSTTSGTTGTTGSSTYSESKHPHFASTAARPTTTQETTKTTAGPHSSDVANKTDPRVDSDHSTTQDTHTARNTAVGAGVVGAGAAVVAHEYSKEDAEKAIKEQQREFEKQQKAHEKQLAHDDKVQEKELKKEQKAHEKAVAKEEKAHEKEHEKEEKKHHNTIVAERKKDEKEHEKAEREEKKHHDALIAEQKRHDEEAERRRKHEEEKLAAAGTVGAAGAATHQPHERTREEDLQPAEEEKHKKGGILGFLHRDKTHDEAVSRDDEHHTKEKAAVGATGAGVVADREHEKHTTKEEKAIHKEAEHEDHKEKKHGILSFLHRDKSKKYTDEEEAEFARQEHEHNTKSTTTGTALTDTDKHERSRLHKDPPADHPAAQASKDGIVTDPITGLPMDVGKYGSTHEQHVGTDGPIGGIARDYSTTGSSTTAGTTTTGTTGSHGTTGTHGNHGSHSATTATAKDPKLGPSSADFPTESYGTTARDGGIEGTPAATSGHSSSHVPASGARKADLEHDTGVADSEGKRTY